MKKDRLLMKGRNFLIDMDGRIAKYGFFQNFFLEAESPEKAESLAAHKIREDEGLKNITRNPKEGPPVIFLEEITRIESFDGVEAMESGKAWFRDKKWWQFWK